MDLFPDGRANRGEIAGHDRARLARGRRRCSTAASSNGAEWTTGFPKTTRTAAVRRSTTTLVKRGQNRFNIYCTPCHGYDGRGNGMVPERVEAGGGAVAGAQPRRGADADGKGGVVVQMPNGQLFNTISNGYNTMMGYARPDPARGSLGDRRSTSARSQRAQNASLDDVPADQQGSPMPMSASPKSLHPDEKIKAGKLGSSMIEGRRRHRRRVPRSSRSSSARCSRRRSHWKRVPLRLRDRLELHRQHLRSACCG